MFLRANFLTESALVALLMSTIMEAPIPRSHQFAEVSSGSTSWQQTFLKCNPNLRKLTTEETNNLFLLIAAVENDYETGIETIVNSEKLNLLKFFMNILKSDLRERSRTAKLWLQYLSYVRVLKDFIRAERTGNWKLHLQSVHAMLNLFAVTGHVHYAKCARLYYQQMMELNTKFPWVHDKLINEGFHTVRRCSRFWSGLWTDLTIEQVMMRSIKSRGGLTRARGVTESVRTLWINTAHRCASIHDAVTELTGLKHVTSEQHVEMSKSRRKKDNETTEKLKEWFIANNPFDPCCPELRSLSTRMVATEVDKINCDNVEKVGFQIQQTLENQKVSSSSIKRKDEVRTLACLQNEIKINDNTVYIKPDILFGRMSVLVRNYEERTNFFDYELTPEPTTLFVHGKMRKPTKHKSRNHLLKAINSLPDPHADVSVIDGGDLLYHTSWKYQSTYEEIAATYLKFIEQNFKSKIIWVVFDGNTHKNSIKGDEHSRRSLVKSSATVSIKNPKMKLFSNKQEFLRNRSNKMQLIQLLKTMLVKAGIRVKQSAGDADVMIRQVAIDLADEGKTVEVAGKDTDLSVLLIQHYKSGMKLFFRTSFKDEEKCKETDSWWNIGQVASNIQLKEFILFAHIWGGCDTTSATYQHGKRRFKFLKCTEIDDFIRNLNRNVCA